MTPIELRPRPLLSAVWFGGTLGAAAVFAYFSYSAPESWKMTGYYLAILLVVVGSLSAWRSRRGPAPLTITEEGLTLGGGGTILWKNLAEVGTYKKRTTLGDRPLLVLRLKSREKFRTTLDGRPDPLLAREFSDGWDLQLPAASFPMPLDEVVELIGTQRR